MRGTERPAGSGYSCVFKRRRKRRRTTGKNRRRRKKRRIGATAGQAVLEGKEIYYPKIKFIGEAQGRQQDRGPL